MNDEPCVCETPFTCLTAKHLCACGHAYEHHAPLGCVLCRIPELGYPCGEYREATA